MSKDAGKIANKGGIRQQWWRFIASFYVKFYQRRTIRETFPRKSILSEQRNKQFIYSHFSKIAFRI